MSGIKLDIVTEATIQHMAGQNMSLRQELTAARADNMRLLTLMNRAEKMLADQSQVITNQATRALVMESALFAIRDGITGLYGSDLEICNKALETVKQTTVPFKLCENVPAAEAVMVDEHLIGLRPIPNEDNPLADGEILYRAVWWVRD